MNLCHLLTFSSRRDLRLKQQEAIKANTVAGGLVERRKLLAKSIQEFRAVQKVYMPGVSHLLDEADDDSGLNAHPELYKLTLPSQLSAHNRESWCLPGLSSLEARFRSAQADDALAEIRRLRRLYQGLSDQGKKHITNTQHTVTRTKATFERYKARISRFATLYRHARRILITLDPKGEVTGWPPRLLELDESDIRGPGREDDERSEGHTVPSWIWQVAVPPDTSDAVTNNPKEPDLSSHAASGEEVAVSIRAHLSGTWYF